MKVFIRPIKKLDKEELKKIKTVIMTKRGTK